ILHKGNGENIFLSQQPPVISTVMGNGFYRSVPCGPSCSGAAREMMLFAPVALASGPDGSLYIGDFNFIRRVHPDGYTRTILELKNRDTRHSTSPAHKYYLAMDPVGEVLYVSDTSSRRVYRVRNLGQPKDPARNLEVVAGTGEQCLPFDQSHCGEGRKATEAALNNPRGKDNMLNAAEELPPSFYSQFLHTGAMGFSYIYHPSGRSHRFVIID
ncbi:Teneurin-1, partial [Xenoophorus captivus]